MSGALITMDWAVLLKKKYLLKKAEIRSDILNSYSRFLSDLK